MLCSTAISGGKWRLRVRSDIFSPISHAVTAAPQSPSAQAALGTSSAAIFPSRRANLIGLVS